MKKFTVILSALLLSVSTLRAEWPGFTWSVGADITSNYLWRGLNLGGLAFQPDVMIGYGGLEIEGWANLSPTDYTFKTFAPELDMTISYNLFGLRVGITHYHYFDGSKYFNFKGSDFAAYKADDYNTNQTEVFAEYHLGDVLESVPLSIGWYTYILGDDRYAVLDPATNDSVMKQAYSSYLELSYDFCFEKVGLTLTPTIGITPWTSFYTDFDTKKGFAVNNISLKLSWDFQAGEHATISLYGLGMLNTHGITTGKDGNLFPVIKDTYNNRHLNFAIGLGVYLE